MAKLHGDLLEQAKRLATVDLRRPKQASLRRSVSTSYYALFHAIGDEWSRIFRAEVRAAASRMLGHNAANKSAKQISNGCPLEWMAGTPACPADLQQVAGDFAVLQAKRHLADYNLYIKFTRRDALLLRHRRRDQSAT